MKRARKYHQILAVALPTITYAALFQNCAKLESSQNLSTPPDTLTTREQNFESQAPTASNTPCANAGIRINTITDSQPADLWGKDKSQMLTHCKKLGLEVPGPTQLHGLFTYQGAYQRMAADADELVCRLARFKTIYLTHAFALINENSAFAPQDGTGCTRRTASGNVFDPTDPYLMLKNGRVSAHDVNAAMDGAYFDAHGRGIFYVISKLRHLHGSNINIYGYVATTVDNPEGVWQNHIAAQNYLCPNGVCTDFINFVNKWRSLEKTWANSWLDGFFVDMGNEFYVNEITYLGQVGYIHSLKSTATGLPYKAAVNTLATEVSMFYPSGNAGAAVVSSSKRPIPWAAQFLRSGDSVLIEGFVYKAGKLLTDLTQVGQELQALASQGVNWSAVGTETTYIPPMFIPGYDSLRERYAGTLYANLGGLSLEQAYSSYNSLLPTLISLNSGHYFRAKSQQEMARYLVDYNMYLGARQQSGQGLDGNRLCQYILNQTNGDTGSSSAVTVQESGYSCFDSAKTVNCASARWHQIVYYFNTWGGRDLTYHEGALGTYSGLYNAGCFWSNYD